MGGLPPDGHPSGAGLTRGTRRPTGLVTPSRVAPHRGGASSQRRGQPAAWWVQWRLRWTYGVTGTCWAMAPRKPASARAMATTTWLACGPRASRRRKRLHRRTWRLPTEVLNRLGELLQPAWHVATDGGGIPVGPGAFDQGASGLGVAGCGDRHPAGGAPRWNMLRGAGRDISSGGGGAQRASGRRVRPRGSRPRCMVPPQGCRPRPRGARP